MRRFASSEGRAVVAPLDIDSMLFFVNGRLNDQTCGFLSHLGYPGSGGPLFAYPAACSHAADRFAVRDERNSPMIHNRAPLARLLLLEGESYEEISL
jgi:hypothetical protein